MRVLHTADIHAGITRYQTPGQPHARLDDVAGVLARMRAIADSEGVSLVIIAGDTFDTRNPSPRAQAVVTRGLRDIADVCETVVVPGNHDGMWTIGDPTSHTLQWLHRARIPGLTVALGPELTPVPLGDGEKAIVASIPYPHKRAYDALHPDMDPMLRHESMTNDLEAAITSLHAAARVEAEGGPVIFAGHLSAVGSRVGSERTMRLEDDIMVSTDVLDLFDYSALGHIHKRQPVGTKGWYPGSPLYIDWGECDQTKAFLLAEVSAGAQPSVSEVPTEARPMFEVEFDGGRPFETENVGEALLRLMGHYPDRRSAAAAKAVLVPAYYRRGAAHVQWDPEVPEEQRASERALPSSTEPLDAVRAYFTSRGADPEPYIGMARDIMGGVA